MIEVKQFKGHIRNHKDLSTKLNIDLNLTKEEREKEILVKGFNEYKYDLANQLEGHFSFVLYNDENDELYLARDSFGTKPLYYYITDNNEILYGAQIRDFIGDSRFKKELNEDALQIYLSLTYMIGEETFFKGVKKIMPGCYGIFKDGKLSITKYYEKEFYTEEKSIEEYADEIHNTLKEIFTEVKDDTEVATSFLSGGVDSSYVLSMSDCTEVASCGYLDERFDESKLAEETAKLLNRKFNRCIVTPEMFFETVPFTVYNMELPLGDASAIAFTLGCKAVSENHKLCYSGEGADEFFGGYNMYRNAERYGDNLKTFYVGNTNIMKEEEKEALLVNYNKDNLPINYVKDLYEKLEGLDPLTKMSAVDIDIWLEGDIYLNVDKMSTATGIEIRMPLTDRRIFDIARKMPAKYKVNEEQNKVAFRHAASKMLPEEIAFRKKLGFVVPVRIWLADENYNEDVRAKLFSDYSKKFFKAEEVKKIYDEYIGGNSDLWRKVWTMYVFLVWYNEYFIKR